MKKNFWSRFAFIYDIFMRKDSAAYSKMYELMKDCVKNKKVLELATGTGLVARNIAPFAKSVEATDFSAGMIAQAEKSAHMENIHFSVQNMFSLPYDDGSFEVVIVSNALHIVDKPEEALSEIRRVLSDDGILIAPTFTHRDISVSAHIKVRFMKLFGFTVLHKWSPEKYIDFLNKNGFSVYKSEVLKASFPLTYTQCVKQ